MTVTLHSTDQIVEVNGVPARVWEGETGNGIKCFALITRIAVHKEDNAAEFEAELQEHAPPTVSNVFPLRMII